MLENLCQYKYIMKSDNNRRSATSALRNRGNFIS